MLRRHRSKGNASRVWSKPRLTSIAGKQTGLIRAFTALPNARWRRCLPKSDRTCCHYHEPFRFYQYGQRVVHLDGCVEVEAAYYGAPPGWIGRSVQVQWDGLNVRLLHPQTGQLLREHLRQKRGWHRIQEADRSPRTPPTTVQLLERASRAGTHIGPLCTAIHQRLGQVGVRRIQGVLALAKRFGPALVDQACAAALELGVHEYHFVRRYLERQPSLPLTLQQVDPLIREL